jgi:hypothetical protein
MTAVLCLRGAYLIAIKSAEAKDSSINYLRLKADHSLSLLLNPTTGDGMFSTKLAAKTACPDGYYECYPWVMFAETRAENNANLEKYGWPNYENDGV